MMKNTHDKTKSSYSGVSNLNDTVQLKYKLHLKK